MVPTGQTALDPPPPRPGRAPPTPLLVEGPAPTAQLPTDAVTAPPAPPVASLDEPAGRLGGVVPSHAARPIEIAIEIEIEIEAGPGDERR
jgi:hypothetical protein